jgi:hypothetical protein
MSWKIIDDERFIPEACLEQPPLTGLDVGHVRHETSAS